MTKRRFAPLATAVVFSCLSLQLVAGEMNTYAVDKSNLSIAKSLSGKAGDPANGRKLAINRKKGNCLACHTLPIPEQSFHGQIGPPLTGIGARYELAQLRLRVVDPKIINPNSIMPAFFKNSGFVRPIKKFEGKSILNAQEIEDVIAYLSTLK